MSTAHSPDEVAALRETARAAEFELTLAYEEIAQKVAAGDAFTTAQQNAAAQLLEISAAVREVAADTSRPARERRHAHDARGTRPAARGARGRAARGVRPAARQPGRPRRPAGTAGPR